MKKVTILCPYNTMATTIFGPMDILNQAGRLWGRITQAEQHPFFDVTLATADGKPVQSANNIRIQPHCSIAEVDRTDLIIISSATFIDLILEKNPELVPWLLGHYEKGCHIASICTGVFLLAETGLLDGRSATLHWGFTQMFKEKYPHIRLEPEKIYLDHGRLYCSAGVSAGLDLSLYLVEKFCGRQAALESAKTMVLDLGRQSQSPYDCFIPSRKHGDGAVIKAQEWIEQNQTRNIDYDVLAANLRMSRRSLERRFKSALGLTPLGYLQKLRVALAKQQLETGIRTFNEITYAVGYEDISFFRKIFIRETGLRPREYQLKFAGFTGTS